jgi:hypothetical protein
VMLADANELLAPRESVHIDNDRTFLAVGTKMYDLNNLTRFQRKLVDTGRG